MSKRVRVGASCRETGNQASASAKGKAAPRARNLVAALAFAAPLLIHGCAVTGGYPESWPQLGPQQLTGKCPDIAGTYENSGTSAPADALALSLSQIFGLGSGDTVEILQTPETINVVLRRSGQIVEEANFPSAEAGFGWDSSRARAFMCPYDVLSGRVLYFSHQSRSEIGGSVGLVVANWSAVRFKKMIDGSLAVLFTKGTGAIVILVPVGTVDQVWYWFRKVN